MLPPRVACEKAVTDSDKACEIVTITQDEESSGIIDASRFLGAGAFLLDAQVHQAHPDPDKVERGQLMELQVRDWKKVFD